MIIKYEYLYTRYKYLLRVKKDKYIYAIRSPQNVHFSKMLRNTSAICLTTSPLWGRRVEHRVYCWLFRPGAKTEACNMWYWIFVFLRFHGIWSGSRQFIMIFLYTLSKPGKKLTIFLSSWIISLSKFSIWRWSSRWVRSFRNQLISW